MIKGLTKTELKQLLYHIKVFNKSDFIYDYGNKKVYVITKSIFMLIK
jgi:hypothetical protein